MFQKIIGIFKNLKNTNRVRYYFENISNSVITIINGTYFEVTERWFKKLLVISYDEEVKSKYIPDLHEINNFERENLTDILNFQQWIGYHIGQVTLSEENINRFKKSYKDFFQVLEAENILVINEEHPFLKQIKHLYDSINTVEIGLLNLKTIFSANDYSVLSLRNEFNRICNPIESIINFSQSDWQNFLNKNPETSYSIHYVFQDYNQIYYGLNDLNRMLDEFKTLSSYKIIIGNAGTGKTHILAHLVNKINANRDYVLFFKPKQFNGDNINLNDKLLQLLQIPPGHTLAEILEKINQFALISNKRCFFIIDALNETTKSSIGFSNIWRDYLQEFINQLSLFSNLYLVCTLRTSYVEQIWNSKPSPLLEIKGFERERDLRLLCSRYFQYYNIEVLNFETADLSIFRVPLLLDLYCKLINEKRIEQKEITLDIKTYLQIFEDYISGVSTEVQSNLNLLKKKLIIAGFYNCSEVFFQNNEAIVSIDDFNDAFDADDHITIENSIARAVLEGYLIFVREAINRNDEIVKHTQQEIGGYLLAKYLSNKFSLVEELFEDNEFNDKVLGIDPAKQHQLRLDILKFLIAIRPEVITHLKTKESINLSWWYLYNGFSPDQGDIIPNYLLSLSHIDYNLIEVISISSGQWFNPNFAFNFHFFAKVLEKLDLWLFDQYWTFAIYNNSNTITTEIHNKITELKEFNDLEYHKVVAKFIAFVTATTIRELRDLATIYLIEFGKKYPIELLELTEYSTTLVDEYIYERLSSCCYGVCLINQNDDEFIRNRLPEIAQRLYQLQFAENATHPVYNYIVIDSIKHLIDLAIFKGVVSLSKPQNTRLDKYKFNNPYNWVSPSRSQQNIINRSNEMSWPEPIGMDFGIYTIPRLIDDEYGSTRKAIANVYKRIFELGYQQSDSIEFNDEEFKDFYFGHRIYGDKGKVDRLGKKYSWKGFFDYAGKLLLNGKLDVFEKYSGKGYYKRLSDVDIDICLPSKDYKKAIRLYEQDLITNRISNSNWHTEVKIDSIRPLFENSFFEKPYTMLYGMIEQRINEEYKTRSYLLVETTFIQKNEYLEKAKEISEITFPSWDLDNHFSRDNLSQTYFGELYWADNIGVSETIGVSVRTGKKRLFKRTVTDQDIFLNHHYSFDDVGKEIEEEKEERLYFQSEPSLTTYSWESDSLILKGLSEYYPSLKMGKSLGLRADPESGKILDQDLNECFQCIEFKDQYFENNFRYIRRDLLRKYMDDNNLALLYQVKQHSYDEEYRHNRSMKFFIID